MQKQSIFSLLGNPNCGKTAVFNLLTGMDQKVSNYPGITVEKKSSTTDINNNLVTFEDYPGSYSLQPQSLDEKIVHDSIFSWINRSSKRPDGIIYIADITNLRRNLYFLTQILVLDIPIIILFNMSDLVDPKSIVDVKKLDITEGQAINNYIRGLNHILEKSDPNSILILETGAGQGTEICTDLIDLGKLRDRIDKKFRHRVVNISRWKWIKQFKKHKKSS